MEHGTAGPSAGLRAVLPESPREEAARGSSGSFLPKESFLGMVVVRVRVSGCRVLQDCSGRARGRIKEVQDESGTGPLLWRVVQLWSW